MPEENTTTPAPSEPIPAPAAPEPRGQTLAEQKFFASRDASSLPPVPTDIPIEPSNQEPTPAAPLVPDTAAVAAPAPAAESTPEAIPETDFSTTMPGETDGVLIGDDMLHPDSPLDASAPPWQHEEYRRLQADSSLSDEDKKAISELPPSKWAKARKWQADTKLLGQFRNPEIPISQVFDVLKKQSKERVAALEVESLARLVQSGEGMVEFSRTHPQLYGEIMSEMINSHTEFVQKALQKKGFNLVKQEPVSMDSIKAKLKANPLYETFADTDLEDLILQEYEALAQRLQPGEVTPEDLIPGDQPDTVDTAHFQALQQTVSTVRETQWIKAVSDGVQASGIKPATQEEAQRNPAAAHLKTLIYNVAVHGLPGVMTGWDEHSDKWGQAQPGFTSTRDDLRTLLREGDLESFTANAPSMNPFYYDFGTKRGTTPLIQNLYRQALKMFETAPPAPVPTTQPPLTNGNAPTPEVKGQTYAERKYFASLGK